MAVPTSYLTSTKNLKPILDAIRRAQAPKTFTTRFLAGLGFKSSSDRLVVGVLKSLGFLTEGGQPTERYFRFLDSSQSSRVLAEAVRDAYSDLFELNASAEAMSRSEVKDKLKTVTQGEYSDSVLDKMALTFKALADQADFSSSPPEDEELEEVHAEEIVEDALKPEHRVRVPIQGLVYTIEIHLPESRDTAVYDALFQSLREHLLT